MPPRVAFGPRTNMEGGVPEAVAMSACPVAPDQGACHMVVEAADPRSPLRVARSYFLSRGTLVNNIFAGGGGGGWVG